MSTRAHVAESLEPPPIFIGGTGRSGTTVLGSLLDSHPDYAVVPIELRFHTESGGLLDVLAQRTSLAAFAARMNGPFFERTTLGGPRGLHLIATADAVAEAVEKFVDAFAADRFTAARNLMLAFVQPVADRSGKRGWVEMTPWNVGVAPMLHRLFPEMKLVHITRDGRDVAASVASMWWGPDDPIDGLYWWWDRMLGAEAAARMVPPGTTHILQLERLVLTNRDTELAELCAYLEIADAEMRQFFDTEMAAGRAHIGRWREEFDPETTEAVDRIYSEMVSDLEANLVSCRPLGAQDRPLM